jgi:hypothetical protein
MTFFNILLESQARPQRGPKIKTRRRPEAAHENTDYRSHYFARSECQR